VTDAARPVASNTTPLPEHRHAAGRIISGTAAARSQVRAILPKGKHNEAEFLEYAARLANEHGYSHAHVMFFDDASTLAGWDGTGLLRDSDWPHWLYDAYVDDSKPRRGRIAKVESTGEDRTDVFAKP
jgi:hypothetical protein